MVPETTRIRVVLGLGNPGARYARSRHNAGFLVLEGLRTAPSGWVPREHRDESFGLVGGREILLVRPTTYMNRSGWAVAAVVEERACSPAEILVVSDDVSLPMGRIRVRKHGGSGGHRGLASVEASLRSSGYPRLRVGVSGPPPEVPMEDFVLEPLEDGVWSEFQRAIDRAVLAARSICEDGVEAAMNRFNPRSVPDGNGNGAEGGEPASRESE